MSYYKADYECHHRRGKTVFKDRRCATDHDFDRKPLYNIGAYDVHIQTTHLPIRMPNEY
jgi:hypothetical protein